MILPNQAANDYIIEQITTDNYLSQLCLEGITDLEILSKSLNLCKCLKKLSLHGNRLSNLPTNLDFIGEVQYLDISNNPSMIPNVLMGIIRSLKKLTQLKRLVFPVRSKKIQKWIVDQLTTLEYLNNTKIDRNIILPQYQYKKMNENTIKQYISKIQSKFQRLLKYQEQYLGQVHRASQYNAFITETNRIADEALKKLKNSKDKASESLEKILFSNTKFQMFAFLKERSIIICKDACGQIGNFIEQIIKEQDNLVNDIIKQTLHLVNFEYATIQKQEKMMQKYEQQGQFLLLKKNKLMDEEIKRNRKQKQQLLAQINQLQNYNRSLHNSLSYLYRNNPKLKKTLPKQHQQSIKTQRKKQLEVHHGSQMIIMQQQTRNITLNNLKQFIEEIYESKQKYDVKNYQGKLPKESMNNYIFTYLNQKYGLKSLTISAAASIISSVQKYYNEDTEVLLFCKILRNQIDQDYRKVLRQLKQEIYKLSMKHRKQQYDKISKENKRKKLINIYISLEQMQDIIHYLHSLEHENQLIELIRKDVEIEQIDQTKRHGQLKKTIRKMQLNQFVQKVLNFQLKKRSELLHPVSVAFHKFDKDKDGIVNQEQFIAIINDLCQSSQPQIDHFLNIVDKYQSKTIDFSQIAKLVSQYPRGHSILARIHSQNQGRGRKTLR